MPFIEVHAGLPHHAKVGRLMAFLKISRAQAVGHLTCLWSYCIGHHPGGVLRIEDAAPAAEWEGDPDLFVTALLANRWAEIERPGFLTIHDWQDFTSRYAKAKKDWIRQKSKRVASAEQAQSKRVFSAEPAGTGPDLPPSFQEGGEDNTPQNAPKGRPEGGSSRSAGFARPARALAQPGAGPGEPKRLGDILKRGSDEGK